ncbi:MAG: hypothetical protein U0R19_37850 [Bryobacteraceae bacterium]
MKRSRKQIGARHVARVRGVFVRVRRHRVCWGKPMLQGPWRSQPQE